MPDREIQLVCFDLGGVLIRLCDGWDHACALAGVVPSKPMSEEDRRRAVDLVHREEVGELHNGEFFRLTAPLLGLKPDDAHAMADAWLRGAFPGIDTLIDAIHHAGFQTACLSNTNENHWRAMTDPGHANGLPLARLTHRFASHLVRDRKPNASIYRHVEQVTGLPAGAILFFDDAQENVEAARDLGWNAVRITDPDDPAAQMTSYLKGHNLL